MASCTFFGHRDCPASIRDKLNAVLIDLIEHHGVDTFYFGNHGLFDATVQSVLSQLKTVYPQIQCTIVLAYMPSIHHAFQPAEGITTLLPDDIENAPRRFAIVRRNTWMLKHAAYVVAYVAYSASKAAEFTAMAQKQGRTVINLHDTP